MSDRSRSRSDSDSDKQQEEPLGVYKCKEILHGIFLQNGNKDRLMAHIRHRSAQAGWTWHMRDTFIDYIKKKGPNNVNVSHMISDLAPIGRERFPADLKQELIETMFEMSKHYFTLDNTVTPNLDPDNANSEPEKTFLYQSKDVKPDPGIGVGIDIPDSPPPSPPNSTPPSSPSESAGAATASTSAASAILCTPPRQSPLQALPRQSPVQSHSRHSPAAATRSPVSATAVRPSSPPQPLPPPPVLRPEMIPAPKVEPIVAPDVDEDDDDDDQEEDDEDDDDEEDARTNDEEDELMDV